MIWPFIQRVALIIIAILAVVLALSWFVPRIKQYHDLQKVEVERSGEVHAEQETLDQLKKNQEKLRNDPRFVERVAREEIGMAKPGEIVFRFVDEAPRSNAVPRRK
jgi:cell division protein FtsB